MKVYIIKQYSRCGGDVTENYTTKIFSNEEDAERYTNYWGHCEVEEVEVDKYVLK